MQNKWAMAIKPVTDVRAEPKFRSERVHQIVFGEIVELLEEQIDNEYLYICDKRVDYRGYVNRNTLH
ncbi:MAG: SH3 domain-containing protein, partial [Fervidobacterium sp.]